MREFLLFLLWLCGNIALPIPMLAQGLEIETLWVDDLIQNNKNTIFMRSSQILIVKIKQNQQMDSFYFILKHGTSSVDTLLSSSVNVYHNLAPGDYKFYAACKDSMALQTPVLDIKVKSGIIGNWGFVLLLIIYISLLSGSAYAFISMSKLRGQQKLAELRADWTNMLHNDIGGDLSGISLRLDILKRKAALDSTPTLKDDIIKIYDLLKSIQIKLRFVFDVVDPKKNSIPIMLEDVKKFGQEHAQLKGMAFEFRNEMNPAVNTKLDINRVNKLYLVMKEAITNAVKYSKGSIITVDLQNIKQDLLIKISDDGVGFDARSNIGRGNGLSNLIDYGKQGYMKVDIDSALGKGTSIKIYIPQL